MPSYVTSGFKNLSVSGDGLVVSFTFAQPNDGEDIDISLPAEVLSVVMPYFAQVTAEAARRRESLDDPTPPKPDADPE